jgi:flagellar protein FlgJ
MAVKNDPGRFFEEIAKAGYATDPNYATNLKSVITTIEKYI